MTSLPLTKKCFECSVEKPRAEYWCAQKGTNRLTHLAKRRTYKYGRTPPEKKVRGFAALDAEKREGILEMWNTEPKPKKNAVAKKFGIPYTTFCRWTKNGSIV